MTRISTIVLLVGLSTVAAVAQEAGQQAGQGDPSFIGAAYELRTKKYGFGLVDAQGKWLKPSFGTGLEMTPIKFDFFDNDDPTTNFLDFKWKGLGLLEGGKFKAYNLRDVFSAFQTTDNSYSLGAGLHTILFQDLNSGLHPSLQAYAEYATARDTAGTHTNKARFALELRMSTAAQENQDELRDPSTYTATAHRFGTREIAAFKAVHTAIQAAKATERAALLREEARVQSLPLIMSDTERKAASAPLRALQDTSERRTRALTTAFDAPQGARLVSIEASTVLETALIVEGVGDPSLQFLQESEAAPLAGQLTLAREVATPLISAFRALADAEAKLRMATAQGLRASVSAHPQELSERDREFIVEATAVLSDLDGLNEAAITARRQNLEVSPVRYLFDKLGAQNQKPKLNLALQGYGWVSEKDRARGYLSFNLLYTLGKSAANSTFSPGFGISVLVGDLPTGVTAKPKIQLQLAIPLN